MKTFRINKKSGTYAELLEVYGLSNTIHKIFVSIEESDADIVITDKDSFYELTTSVDLSVESLNKLSYFPLFKFIKYNNDVDLDKIEGLPYYNYPQQKEWRKEKNELLQKTYKEYCDKDRVQEKLLKINEIETIFKTIKPIDAEYDVYSQISSKNNITGFLKSFNNLFCNKDYFVDIITAILVYYSSDDNSLNVFEKKIKDKKIKLEKNIKAIQLYNPSQGQGLNKLKSNGLNRRNLDSIWISETMKISGALSDMICQLVKVGSSYDLKVFVPEYMRVNWGFKDRLIPDFKKCLKGCTSPIKIDILYILLLTQKILEHSKYSDRHGHVNDVVSGLHSVYQKNLGQNKAVVNIGFLQIPNFIEIGSRDENIDWIEILEEQKKIIISIDEKNGSVIQGLKYYRNFISGSDLDSFFRFSFWYSTYIITQKSKNKYVRIFTIETLNKLFSNMAQNVKLMEIINDNGFQAIAKAIRKSTVTLQYTPKEARKFDIRYGVAQMLQTKSKSKEDLAEFIGDFIATYNAETARYKEKKGEPLRANVRENELLAFYTLLENNSSKLVGALLASYGFALAAKERTEEDIEPENEDDLNED